MASVFPHPRSQKYISSGPHGKRLARAMTWNVSLALLAFAGVQIWATVAFFGMPGGGGLPFLSLGILLLVAIPFVRRMDRRWNYLAETALPCTGLVDNFRRDRARLWMLTLLVPVLWISAYVAGARLLAFF